MPFGVYSAVFQAWLAGMLGPDPAFGGKWDDLDPAAVPRPEVFRVALFNDQVIPDRLAAANFTGYGTGTWVNDPNQAGAQDPNWPAAGLVLASPLFTVGSEPNPSPPPPLPAGDVGVVTLSGAPTSHLDDDPLSTVTFDTVHGDLLYADWLITPVARQATAYHSYGGLQEVRAGTFTVVWSARGIAVVAS